MYTTNFSGDSNGEFSSIERYFHYLAQTTILSIGISTDFILGQKANI